MIFALAQLALATPPLPTWGAEDRQVPDVDVPVDPPASATTHGTSEVRGRRSFPATESNGATWADERDLVVTFSGDIGKLYYIMGTVQGVGLVSHFRQGPFAGENISVDVPVQLPAELVEPLTEVGRAHLSLRLAITTLDGRDLAQQPLGRTHIGMVDGSPTGALAPLIVDQVVDDSAFSFDDDTQPGATP